MIVSDLLFRLVERLADHVLRHVDSCREGVPRLNRILTISPHSLDRVPEDQLLESPLAAMKITGRIKQLMIAMRRIYYFKGVCLIWVEHYQLYEEKCDGDGYENDGISRKNRESPGMIIGWIPYAELARHGILLNGELGIVGELPEN